MTRIDTQLAAPAGDKPADKVTGKTTSKDGDNRQAAFRALMRQLGGHEKVANRPSDKDAKSLAGDAVKGGAPSTRNRTHSKDDPGSKTNSDKGPNAPQACEPTGANEPVLAWQAILGRDAKDRLEQTEQPPTNAGVAALTAARAPNAEGAVEPPEKTAHQPAGPMGRSMSAMLPSTANLDLVHADAPTAAGANASDPFAALSSLLDRATGTAPDEAEMTDAPPIKMSVVTRETHFEPVARLSPVQQIASAVGEELVAMGEPSPTEGTSPTTEPVRHSTGPLKVLHVKLEPEDLGSVVLKMRLVDKSLELEVVASRQETADLLAKDRDMLTRMLRSSGYSADVVAISTSTVPDTGQTTGDNRAGAQTSTGQPGAQTGGNRGSNDSTGHGDRPPARSQPMEGAPHEESGTGRSGSDLYL